MKRFENSNRSELPARRAADEAAILRERAAALARVPTPTEAASARLEYIAFTLNQEEYGLELIHLREVLPVQSMAPLTTAPEFVAGMINFRGQILTVIDLRTVLGISEHPVSAHPCVLVLQSPGRQFGLLAQALIGIRGVNRSDLQATLPGTGGRAAEYLLGITPEQVGILDGARIVADPKLTVNEEVY